MVKAINTKGTVLLVTTSFDKAFNGLQKGTYKVGTYFVTDEESGKTKRFVKYICERKSRA